MSNQLSTHHCKGQTLKPLSRLWELQCDLQPRPTQPITIQLCTRVTGKYTRGLKELGEHKNLYPAYKHNNSMLLVRNKHFSCMGWFKLNQQCHKLAVLNQLPRETAISSSLTILNNNFKHFSILYYSVFHKTTFNLRDKPQITLECIMHPASRAWILSFARFCGSQKRTMHKSSINDYLCFKLRPNSWS